MTIKRFSNKERSPRVMPIGKIFKGDRKTGNKPGANLDYFRFEPGKLGQEDLTEIWEHFYGDRPTELHIFFKHNDIDKIIDDWFMEFGTGGLLKTRCDGETIVEWRDERGKFYPNSPKPCRDPDSQKGCSKCRASALIKFGMPEFRYHGYSGNVELSTTSINDIVYLKAQLEAIAQELALVNTQLAWSPLILSRAPRVITKTTAQKQFRGEENLLSITIDPIFQQRLDRAISERQYTAIGGTYEAKALLPAKAEPLPVELIVEDDDAQTAFWDAFRGGCDRCDSQEKLGKLTQWAVKHPAYKQHPDNENAVAEMLAAVSDRLKVAEESKPIAVDVVEPEGDKVQEVKEVEATETEDDIHF